jgi:hypothetical protein
LNERSITHKLGSYLQFCFHNYDVDCEYNKNIEHPDGNKLIILTPEEIHQFRLKHKSQKKLAFYKRRVFPDIIIHERGTNRNNLLVIEVKKSTSEEETEFDLLKLRKYTSNTEGIDYLRYTFGVFILFRISERNPGIDDIIWFHKGDIISRDEIGPLEDKVEYMLGK